MEQTKNKTAYSILFAIAIAHTLNDLLQAVITASYPQLQQEFGLSMTQIGIITLCYQISASIFQPLVGNFTDKTPLPYSQVIGMIFTSLGIITLSFSTSYLWVLVAVFLVGTGSSIFHPESSRVAYLASGGKRSLAQSIFQLGGNSGTAIAPLLIALIVIPYGKIHSLWFLIASLLAISILIYVGKWRSRQLKNSKNTPKTTVVQPDLSKQKIAASIVILLILIFSKYFYTAGITNYFQFYTLQKFGLTQVQAQVYLFYFLGAAALGTLLGGIFGDRFGRKFVIWFSVLGAAPFALLLPYVNQQWTAVLIVVIGLIISSAFPAILVYVQELLPKKIGMVSGLFYGFAFGMGGLASAVLGKIIDLTSIDFVYKICSFLPLMGLIAYFLPNLNNKKHYKNPN
ncbi:MFS transporter [Capnocytophaga sp.]|uniref:MFS transporter n=1 Tax=Capnocytophaga sp. TaxID=44737 RepID=UPI0026DD46C6|nr:MFS transporter [Capnocytophaga sp.]MDO5105202.1 MFS transporter [Capnocytophaga sp.]